MPTPTPNSSDFRPGRSVVHQLHAHLVFTPRYRRGVFTSQMLTRCETIMRAVCENFGAELAEFDGGPDHVHLLVRYPPKVAIATLVNSLKGVSARRLRNEFPGEVNRVLWGGHFWSASYFAASVGGAPLSVLTDYIANQQQPN